MDLTTFITGISVGGISGILGMALYAWRQFGNIRLEHEKVRHQLEADAAKAKQELDAKQRQIDAKSERDGYEMDKTKRDDRNAEIVEALNERKEENADLHERLEAQDQRISAMQAKYSTEIAAMQAKYSAEKRAAGSRFGEAPALDRKPHRRGRNVETTSPDARR